MSQRRDTIPQESSWTRTLSADQQQAVLDDLASAEGRPGLLLAELASRVRARKDFPAAESYYLAARSLEQAQGRTRNAVTWAALCGLVNGGLAQDKLRMAERLADQLLPEASDARQRASAKRLLARVARRLEGTTESSSETFGVGGYELFKPTPIRPELCLSDVGGLADAKSEVFRLGILPMKDPETARHYGMESGGGLLLTGPPGCGKTLLAQAAAGQMGVDLLAATGSDIIYPLWGMTERNLSAAFDAARKAAPCVLFFDELDGIAGLRTMEPHSGRRDIVNVLLSEMDGVKSNEGVLVMAASNAPELIDPALMRRGRFDRIVRVPKPDPAAREAIWRIRLAKHPVSSDEVDVRLLAELSEGMTGADIAGAAYDAAEDVWLQSAEDGHRRDVHMLDLLMALERRHVEGRLRGRIREIIQTRWRESLEGAVSPLKRPRRATPQPPARSS